jgi:DNA-binding MarR family transcriptional regulator
MKDWMTQANKVFDNRIRLGIMSVLAVNDKLDFNNMKDLLQLTDGNLASHIAALEKAGYIVVQKQFIGKKPNTTYAATPEGRSAFADHLNALEQLIRNTQ